MIQQGSRAHGEEQYSHSIAVKECLEIQGAREKLYWARHLQSR